MITLQLIFETSVSITLTSKFSIELLLDIHILKLYNNDNLNPLFQLSTRDYEKEIIIVKKALLDLEIKCNVKNGYVVEEHFNKFGWTFFNIQLSGELVNVIEKSGMMEGALGYRIGEQLTNFVGHYLEGKGSNVRIKKIDYG